MRKIALLLAALLPLAAMADTLPAPTGHPCRTGNGTALDFWVGDWTVTNADGTPSGTNRIDRLLDGCAVTETWHGVDKGDDGMSLFTYDVRRHSWDQVWVTQDTSRPGGLKHKTMTGIRHGSAVRFDGTIVTPKGTILDRTTLTPLSDGRVEQRIEWSKDGGKSWKTVFDGFYSLKVGR